MTDSTEVVAGLFSESNVTTSSNFLSFRPSSLWIVRVSTTRQQQKVSTESPESPCPTKGKLTRLDRSQRRKERDGVHDALLSFEPSRTQDPCRRGVYDEGVEEKSSQTGKVVGG
jgi:hypothetical protein